MVNLRNLYPSQSGSRRCSNGAWRSLVGEADGDAERGEVDAGCPVHSVAHRETWPWLPTSGKGVLAPHPWCEKCGVVKVVGAPSAMPIGSVVNLLSRLDRRLREEGRRITEAQMRLILRRVQSSGVVDTFSASRDAQMAVIEGAVSDVLRFQPTTVRAYLLAC